MKILGASLGDCVHVAGLINFLNLARDLGHDTTFLGPAVPVRELLEAAVEYDPDMLAVSYRLTPETGRHLFESLRDGAEEMGLSGKRFVLGGTEPVCRAAEELGFFERTFSGLTEDDDVISFLRGDRRQAGKREFPQSLVERIAWKEPFPVIRHHFGLPSFEDTVEGIERISESEVLDVVSIGPDQNTQDSFFHPGEMDRSQDGAGGVPIRSEEDFRRLYQASRRGNFPLMRCYSGTRDVLKFADVLHRTINNAWAAVPLFWYNVLDGRGKRPLVESIADAQELMRWHAERDIPVEMNEAHHWSLRDAPDAVAVAAAYLGAYNARAAGVKDYVAQFMFNTPPGTSFLMDLAKMLAKLELMESLEGEDFRLIRQTRTGLMSFPPDPHAAKGQLASSTYLQMALRPHIVHVVAYCEADHAATADEVIESCRIARRVIRNCLSGSPDLTLDPVVRERKEELLGEAKEIIEAVRSLGPEVTDPLTDPATLARAVEAGIMDAPQLYGRPGARGEVRTRIIDGACRSVDPSTGVPIGERERLKRLS